MSELSRLGRWAALALATGLLAAPAPAPAADPYQIDVILPLTGPGSFLGKEEADALGVLEWIANKSGGLAGRPVKFAIQDDQSNPQVGVQLANAVLTKKPSVQLGSALVSICNALLPLRRVARRGGARAVYSNSEPCCTSAGALGGGSASRSRTALRSFQTRRLTSVIAPPV